jgi:hypothetical protein
MQASATRRLSELRAQGEDPQASEHVRSRIGQTNKARWTERRAWSGDSKPDADVFRQDILPGLRDIPVSQLASVTGFSAAYCSRIRAGKQVPHPRVWDRLRALIDVRKIGAALN